MLHAVEVKPDVYWVGGVDWNERNFHGYTTDRGSTYNAYLIMDEHPTLIDTCKPTFADELIERVGLADVRRRRIGGFSGGMRRRVGIAQALMGDPRLLVVDEPTAGLDPEERMRFRTLIATLGGDRTVVLSTHILDDVAQTCPYVCVLRAGRLRYDGATAGLAGGAHGRTWLTPPLMAPPSGAVVVNAATTAEGTRYRIVSAAPPAGSQPVEPTLEDGYMALAADDRAGL